MKKGNLTVRKMVILAMLSAILLVMQVTGIGMIPLPGFKLTIMHIPVILGAILLGPGEGAFLGVVFGLCSVWANTTTPNATSMFFSPFMTASGWAGALKALWVSVGTRTLMGLTAGLIWKLLKKLNLNDFAALPITAVLGTLMNTVLVLGSICLLFPQDYAYMNATTVKGLFKLVAVTVATNGIAEMLLAAILVTAIGKALLKYLEKKQGR
jgi:uncharacterized membrane protein